MHEQQQPVVGVNPNVVPMALSWMSLSNLGLPSAERVLNQFPIPVKSPIITMLGKSAQQWAGSSTYMQATTYPMLDLKNFSLWTTLGFFLIDQRESFALGRVVRKDVGGDIALTLGTTIDGKQPGFMMAVESNFFCPFQVMAWDGPGHEVYKLVYQDIDRVMAVAQSHRPVGYDTYSRMLHLNLRDILRIDGANGYPSAISQEIPHDPERHTVMAIEYRCQYLAPPFMLNPRCQPLNERESLAILLGMALHPWVNNNPQMSQPARLLRKFLTDPPNTRGQDFFELLNVAGKVLLKHICATLVTDPESKENALGTWMSCALRTL